MLPAAALPGTLKYKTPPSTKKHHIGQLAPQLVRQAGPKEASANIEQRQQRGKTGGHCSDGTELGFVEFTKLLGHTDPASRQTLPAAWAKPCRSRQCRHSRSCTAPSRSCRNAPDLAGMHVALGDHGVRSIGFGASSLQASSRSQAHGLFRAYGIKEIVTGKIALSRSRPRLASIYRTSANDEKAHGCHHLLRKGLQPRHHQG